MKTLFRAICIVLIFVLSMLLYIGDTQAFFSCAVQINTTFQRVYKPVLEVNGLPTSFYISQVQDFNWLDFVTASDALDGDLSAAVEVSSVPSFDTFDAGILEVNFDVTNSSGEKADTASIDVEVWNFKKQDNGNYHNIALTSHGDVYTWGRNANGQLGDGKSFDRPTPAKVLGLPKIVDVAACKSSSYALSEDGQVYSWGHNGYGHLGNDSTTDSKTPVLVKQPDGVKFKRIDAGSNTVGGLTEDGDLYTWGYGANGVAGFVDGEDTIKTPQRVSSLSNIKQIAFGERHGVAVSFSGEVYSWGMNIYGQLGTAKAMDLTVYAPEKLDYFSGIKIDNICSGAYHSGAVSATGRFFTWGYGNNGRLGYGGTDSKNVPVEVSLPSNALEISFGYSSSGVLTVDGRVFVFGDNAFGKLGLGDTDIRVVPTELEVFGEVGYIALSNDASFVYTKQGTMFASGSGEFGQLATGNNQSTLTPIAWVFVPPEPN